MSRELCARATFTSAGRCQIRGGRKGGLPGSEANGLAANGIARLAKAEGNTMIDDAAPAKLKHFSAHVAMLAQSSMAFAHGSTFWGQQSGMSCIMAMSAGAGDLTPATPAAGSIATEMAMRSARMVRPTLMELLSPQKIAGFAIRWSSVDFASRFWRAFLGLNRGVYS